MNSVIFDVRDAASFDEVSKYSHRPAIDNGSNDCQWYPASPHS